MPSMEPILERARKRFDSERHLVNLLEGDWITMLDDAGEPLQGIRGRPGAFGTTIDGKEIGADLIEMQPGSAFPLHVHPGDHILFGVTGAGNVLVEGDRRLIRPGTSVFVAAEYEHGVGTYRDADEIPDGPGAAIAQVAWRRAGGVFQLLAIGVPHKHVSSSERMRIVR